MFTSLITPFIHGEVDLDALSLHVEVQLGSGIAGLVVCGTPGEGSTPDVQERLSVIRRVVDVVGARVPVLAATGTSDTATTLAFTLMASDLGADGALVVAPYYSRPTQEGIVRHVATVAAQTDLPIVLHNDPARTAVDLRIETIERLAKLPGIVGIVDATADLGRPIEISRRLPDFVQLSGHDATAFGFNTMGGQGVVSVASNVVPGIIVEMQAACERRDVHRARTIAQSLRPLVAALDLESEPATVKSALHRLRGTSPDVRLPIVQVETGTEAAIGDALSASAAG